MASYAVRQLVEKYGKHLPRIRHQFAKAAEVRWVSHATKLDEIFTPLDHSELKPKIQYPLAGEKYLAGSHGPGMPKYLDVPRPGLPQAYRAQNPDKYSVSEWAKLCRTIIDERLSHYGAILFKGLPLYDGSLFSSFVTSMGFRPKGYKGGVTLRPSYDKDAFTFISTLEDKKLTMELHNDMVYLPEYPNKVFFYCDVPPGEGCNGLTPVALGTEVLKKLDPDVVEKFKEKQVRYYSCRPTEGKSYLSWQASFRTNDREEAEQVLKTMGMQFEWRGVDETLFYWVTSPAIITHPTTGEQVWFNQADIHHNSYFKSSPMAEGVEFESEYHYPYHATYGDGSPLELDVLQHIREVKWSCSVGVQLKKTDLIVFDNIKAMHGRMAYSGDRRLLAFLSVD